MKKWKKLLAAVLCFVLAAAVILPSAVPVRAETTILLSGTDGGIDYVLDSDGVLTISAASSPTDGYESGVMKGYGASTTTQAPYLVDNYYAQIITVVFEEGVTSIGKYALCGPNDCANITSITLPSTGLTSIGDMAFGYCTSLKSITIPDSVTSYGEFLFEEDSSLEYIYLGSGFPEKIPRKMFQGCSNDDLEIYFTTSITSLGTSAFGNMESNCTHGTAYVIDETSYNALTKNNYAYTYGYLAVVLVGALDMEALESAVTEASSLTESDYTAESWSSLAAVLAAAKEITEAEDTDSYTQDDVDAAATALTEAIAALVSADNSSAVSALQELVDKVEASLTVKDEADYTEDSWTALSDALAAAKEALAAEADESTAGTTLISTLTALAEDLSSAYEGLTIALPESSGSSEETTLLYTYTTSTAVYGGDDSGAVTGMNFSTIVSSSDVDMSAIAGTEYVVITLEAGSDYQYSLEYGTLGIMNNSDESTLTKYGQYSGDVTDKLVYPSTAVTYTIAISGTDTFSLSAAYTGWGKDVVIANVTSIAFYGSQSSGEEETTTAEDLAAAIEAAKALVESDYADGWDLLLDILEEAQAVYEDPDAAAEEYAVEIKEIEAAIAALTAADNSEAWEALQALIAAAEALEGTDYTDESYAVLADALAYAKEVSESDLLSVITAATESLQAAIDALEEAPEDTEDPNTEDQGTGDTEDPSTEDQGTEDSGNEDDGTEDDGTEADGEVEDGDGTEDGDSSDSDSTDSDSTDSDSTSSTSGKTTADAAIWMMILLAIAGCLAIAGSKKRA